MQRDQGPLSLLDEIRRSGDLGRKVFEGGMGAIYHKIERGTGRAYAIKTYRGDLVDKDPRVRERFARESRLMQQLSHPCIVSYHGSILQGDVWCIVMDFVDGVSLDRVIQASREITSFSRLSLLERVDSLAAAQREEVPPAWATTKAALPEELSMVPPAEPHPASAEEVSDESYVEDCCSVVARVAEALQVAHDKEIVHRDIKPANIILRRSGEPCVVDFGLSRSRADTTLTSQMAGTPEYMSPEQFIDTRHVGHSTDIYSLGVTLYELLALRRPFESHAENEKENFAELVSLVLFGSPAPLRSLNSRVPAAVANVVHKSIANRSEDRYASAGEFSDELRAALGGRRVTAGSYSPASPRKHFSKDRPVLVTVTAFLIFSFAFANGVLAFGAAASSVLALSVSMLMLTAFQTSVCALFAFTGWRLLTGSMWARYVTIAFAWFMAFLQFCLLWAWWVAPDKLRMNDVALGGVAYFWCIIIISLYTLSLHRGARKWFADCRVILERHRERMGG